MRRYAFYLTVSFLAFSIGWFFVYLFMFPNVEIGNEETLPATENFSASVPSYENPLHQESGIDSLISDKQKALLLFGPTIRKWIQKEKIPDQVEPSTDIIKNIAKTRLHIYDAGYLNERQ